MSAADDERYMARALRLARRGLRTTDPNPRVGCVLVRGGQVIGEGFHRRAGEAHAEVVALRACGDARGATAYVTLEPCSHHGRTPPCADALIEAGLSRVVYASRDPNPEVDGRGAERLVKAGIEVVPGVLEAEARELNPGFLSRMERGRPWVRLKLAASLDGRTALASGESRWITGEAARADVQQWRARASAILTGIGTVLADDPRLDVRLRGQRRQPLRVVLDSHGRLPASARILEPPGEVLWLTAEGAMAGKRPDGLPPTVQWQELPRSGPGIDLAAVLSLLAARGINELHVECGPRLAGGWLRAGLVDELVLYVAPSLLGEGARPLAMIGDPASLAAAPGFSIHSAGRVGSDLRIVLRPGEGAG